MARSNGTADVISIPPATAEEAHDTGRASVPAPAISHGPQVSWAEQRMLYNEPTLTALLQEAVPAFKRSGIHFNSLEDGYARATLPLNVDATNQHGTHQATVIALLGDYTGGAALGTVLRGVPLAGVHPVYGPDSACLWLAQFNIKFHEPSSTDLVAEAEVDKSQYAMIRSRFWNGQAILLPLKVTFKSETGNLAAEGEFLYYLRHSSFIAPQAPGKSASTMYQHLLKASARLIANVRGRESDEASPLYHDPYAIEAAGKHGQLLGDRFLSLLPELKDMVAARTYDVDRQLRKAAADGIKQVVMVGAGLDFRPFRFAEAHPELRYFELDLPEMISERERLIESKDLPEVTRTSVPLNLLFDAPADVLSNVEGFDPSEPVFVIYEGCSMYFDGEEGETILSRLADLVSQHPESRIWMDLVSAEVASGKTESESIGRFLEGMAKMGEPFVFGHDAPDALLAPHGLEVSCQTRSDAFRTTEPSEVFAHYQFVVASKRR